MTFEEGNTLIFEVPIATLLKGHTFDLYGLTAVVVHNDRGLVVILGKNPATKNIFSIVGVGHRENSMKIVINKSKVFAPTHNDYDLVNRVYEKT